MTLSTLIDRMRAGDAALFGEIAARHTPALRVTARRVLGCPELAAEVVQDVWLRLWRDRENLAVRDHLGAYLVRAVRNAALDRLDRRRLEAKWRERELVRTAHEEPASMAEPFIPEWDARLERAVRALPPKRREMVLLRWRDGLCYQEIGVRLGVSVKTVENQIGRGLKTLRQALGSGS